MASNTAYPVDDKLRKSIGAIFSNEDQGLGFLGAGKKVLPKSWYAQAESADRPYVERVRALAAKHEAWIHNLAAQTEEFDSSDDTIRLRAEARATLIALHDLFLSFPEAFEG